MRQTEELERPLPLRGALAAEPGRGDESVSVRTSLLRSETNETPKQRPLPTLPEPPVAPVPETNVRRRSGRRISLRTGLFALLPLALLGGAYWYFTGGAVMSTDDAYVEANKVGISTDVSGIVQDVDVAENQHVAAGQILYRLDPRQFQIAFDSAKANLAQTALSIEAMKVDYRRMLSDIDAQQAQVAHDQADFDRYASLVKTDTISKANYDQTRYALQADQAKLVALKQDAEVQLAKLNGNPDIPSTEHPQYQQAKAQLDQAQRELDDTVVKAPFAGVVTDVPSIAQGKYLQASATAFYVVDTDHVWIDVNPKETELTYVQPGQTVTVSIDTYPGRQWQGTVESISPAAAEEFSLLPAENTSGNWVKVVQRVPMRVRVDTSDKSLPSLRAGMSAEVEVDTGHTRGIGSFLGSLLGTGKERSQ